MEVTPDSVKEWLDRYKDVGRDRYWLAEKCESEKRTVDNWLSSPAGIPAKAKLIIEKLMKADQAEEAAKAQTDSPQLSCLALHITTDDLNEWAKAYKLSKADTLEQWAIDTVRSSIRAAMDSESEEHYNIIAFPEIPLLHVAAGIPITSDSEMFSPSREYGKGRFGARLHGDSMAPKYPDGSIVILRQKDTLNNPQLRKGDIYLFVVAGEKTLKRYNTRLATHEEIESGVSYVSRVDGKKKVAILESLNPNFPEIIAKEPIEWLGWLDKKDN